MASVLGASPGTYTPYHSMDGAFMAEKTEESETTRFAMLRRKSLHGLLVGTPVVAPGQQL